MFGSDPFRWVAPIYDAFVRSFLPTERIQQHLALPASGRLLDAGGGTGRVAHILRELVGDVVVFDYSLPMLRQAVRGKGLKGVQGQVECLPFPPHTFARIIVVDAFHHFRDHRRAVQELWRVLAPGGRLVIEEPNVKKGYVKPLAWLEHLLFGSRFYAPGHMARMFRELGAAVKLDLSGRLNAWVIVDKPPYSQEKGP